MLLYTIRSSRQIDLIEVQRDVRSCILTVSLRIIQVLVVHVLAAGLQVAGLVARGGRALRRRLRQVLEERGIVEGGLACFSL